MSYVVLARKWRSKYFEEVVGQGHVARTLINSIKQDRVAHAYLFTGARGVGKTSTARILAKALNCHNGPTEKPCYECPSCLEISAGQSVDVFEIDGASNRGINEIRELREGARYAPSRDRNKIYIIDEVHMLTTEAFNALLKTLEEPPPHVKFIFATTEPQKIPVTILSRCQRFDFKRISQQDIVAHLMRICPAENIEAEKAALQLIARQAAGGMRDALSLLDQVISFAGSNISEEQVSQILGVANRKHLFELSDALLARDAEKALLTLDDVHRYGYDLQQFASEMVNHLRDLMVVSVVDHPEKVTSMTESELTQVGNQLRGVPSELLHRYFSVMIDGAQEMSRSPYPKLIFEMTLVRMCQLEPLVSVDLMVDRLRELEGLLGEDDASPKKKTNLTPVQPQVQPIAQSIAAAMPAQPAPREVPPKPAPTPAPPKPQEPAPQVAKPTPPAPTPEPPQPPTRQESAPPPEPRPSDFAPNREPEPAPKAPARKPKKSLPDMPSWFSKELEEPSSSAPKPKKTEKIKAPKSSGLSFADFTPPPPREEPEEAPKNIRAMEELGYEIYSFADEDDAKAKNEAAINTPESAEAPKLDVDKMPRNDVWRAIVDYVRKFRAPLAATLEHAYVEELTNTKLSVTFLERYMHFVGDEERIAPLRAGLNAIFGESYELVVALRYDDKPLPGFETLAQQRDLELRRRRDELAQYTQEHPIIQRANELFNPAATRVLVALHED